MPWSDYDSPTLLATRDRLLVGLARARDHIAAGTIDIIPPKGHASPRAAGHLCLILLDGVEAELVRREAL